MGLVADGAGEGESKTQDLLLARDALAENMDKAVADSLETSACILAPGSHKKDIARLEREIAAAEAVLVSAGGGGGSGESKLESKRGETKLGESKSGGSPFRTPRTGTPRPGTGGVAVLEAMKTVAEISIQMEFDDMIKAGKDAFETGFAADMASALNIPEDFVLVEGLTAGSVIVAFALTNGPDGADAMDAMVASGGAPDFSKTAAAMGVASLKSTGLVVKKKSTAAEVADAQAGDAGSRMHSLDVLRRQLEEARQAQSVNHELGKEFVQLETVRAQKAKKRAARSGQKKKKAAAITQQLTGKLHRKASSLFMKSLATSMALSKRREDAKRRWKTTGSTEDARVFLQIWGKGAIVKRRATKIRQKETDMKDMAADAKESQRRLAQASKDVAASRQEAENLAKQEKYVVLETMKQKFMAIEAKKNLRDAKGDIDINAAARMIQAKFRARRIHRLKATFRVNRIEAEKVAQEQREMQQDLAAAAKEATRAVKSAVRAAAKETREPRDRSTSVSSEYSQASTFSDESNFSQKSRAESVSINELRARVESAVQKADAAEERDGRCGDCAEPSSWWPSSSKERRAQLKKKKRAQRTVKRRQRRLEESEMVDALIAGDEQSEVSDENDEDLKSIKDRMAASALSLKRKETAITNREELEQKLKSSPMAQRAGIAAKVAAANKELESASNISANNTRVAMARRDTDKNEALDANERILAKEMLDAQAMVNALASKNVVEATEQVEKSKELKDIADAQIHEQSKGMDEAGRLRFEKEAAETQRLRDEAEAAAALVEEKAAEERHRIEHERKEKERERVRQQEEDERKRREEEEARIALEESEAAAERLREEARVRQEAEAAAEQALKEKARLEQEEAARVEAETQEKARLKEQEEAARVEAEIQEKARLKEQEAAEEQERLRVLQAEDDKRAAEAEAALAAAKLLEEANAMAQQAEDALAEKAIADAILEAAVVKEAAVKANSIAVSILEVAVAEQDTLVSEAHNTILATQEALKQGLADAEAALVEAEASGDADEISEATAALDAAKELMSVADDTLRSQQAAADQNKRARELMEEANGLREKAETGDPAAIEAYEAAMKVAEDAKEEARDAAAQVVEAATKLVTMQKAAADKAGERAAARAAAIAERNAALAALEEAMKTTAETSIQMEFDDMLKAGKDDFEAGFIKDMASALNIPEDKVNVDGLEAGSVKVAFALTNGPDGADAMDAMVASGGAPDFSKTAAAMGVTSLKSLGFVVTKKSTPEGLAAAQANLAACEAKLSALEDAETGNRDEFKEELAVTRAKVEEVVVVEAQAEVRQFSLAALREAVSTGDEVTIGKAQRAVVRAVEDEGLTKILRSAKVGVADEKRTVDAMNKALAKAEVDAAAGRCSANVVAQKRRELVEMKRGLLFTKAVVKMSEKAVATKVEAVKKQAESEGDLAAALCTGNVAVIAEAQEALSGTETDAENAERVATAACLALKMMAVASANRVEAAKALGALESDGSWDALPEARKTIDAARALLVECTAKDYMHKKIAQNNSMLIEWSRKATRKAAKTDQTHTMYRADKRAVNQGGAVNLAFDATAQRLRRRWQRARDQSDRLQETLLLMAGMIEDQDETIARVAGARARYQHGVDYCAQYGEDIVDDEAKAMLAGVQAELNEAVAAQNASNSRAEALAADLVHASLTRVEEMEAGSVGNHSHAARALSAFDSCIAALLQTHGHGSAVDSESQSVESLARAVSTGARQTRTPRSGAGTTPNGDEEGGAAVLMQGVMFQHARNNVGKWNARWVVIAGGFLQCFPNLSDARAVRVLANDEGFAGVRELLGTPMAKFELAKLLRTTHVVGTRVLTVETDYHSGGFQLRASDHRVAEQWFLILQGEIDRLRPAGAAKKVGFVDDDETKGESKNNGEKAKKGVRFSTQPQLSQPRTRAATTTLKDTTYKSGTRSIRWKADSAGKVDTGFVDTLKNAGFTMDTAEKLSSLLDSAAFCGNLTRSNFSAKLQEAGMPIAPEQMTRLISADYANHSDGADPVVRKIMHRRKKRNVLKKAIMGKHVEDFRDSLFDPPCIEGLLKKRGRDFPKLWRERYFQINCSYISYFKRRPGQKASEEGRRRRPLRALDLRQAERVYMQDISGKDTSCEFVVLMKDRRFSLALAAATPREARQWVDSLTNLISVVKLASTAGHNVDDEIGDGGGETKDGAVQEMPDEKVTEEMAMPLDDEPLDVERELSNVIDIATKLDDGFGFVSGVKLRRIQRNAELCEHVKDISPSLMPLLNPVTSEATLTSIGRDADGRVSIEKFMRHARYAVLLDEAPQYMDDDDEDVDEDDDDDDDDWSHFMGDDDDEGITLKSPKSRLQRVGSFVERNTNVAPDDRSERTYKLVFSKDTQHVIGMDDHHHGRDLMSHLNMDHMTTDAETGRVCVFFFDQEHCDVAETWVQDRRTGELKKHISRSCEYPFCRQARLDAQHYDISDWAPHEQLPSPAGDKAKAQWEDMSSFVQGLRGKNLKDVADAAARIHENLNTESKKGRVDKLARVVKTKHHVHAFRARLKAGRKHRMRVRAAGKAVDLEDSDFGESKGTDKPAWTVLISKETQKILGFNDPEHALEIMKDLDVANTEKDEEADLVRLFFADKQHRIAALEWIKGKLKTCTVLISRETQKVLKFDDHKHALEIMDHLDVASTETDEKTGFVRLIFADLKHRVDALEWIKSKLKTVTVLISRETQKILGFTDHTHASEIMDHLEVAGTEMDEEEGLVRLIFADEQHRVDALEWIKAKLKAVTVLLSPETQKLLGINDHTHAMQIMDHLEVASSEIDKEAGLIRLFFANKQNMVEAVEWIKLKLKKVTVLISRETQKVLGFDDHEHALEIMKHLEVASSETEEKEGLVRLIFADEQHRVDALAWIKLKLKSETVLISLETQRVLGFNDHTHALEIMKHLEVTSSETDETTGLVRLFFTDREHMHTALEWIKGKLKSETVLISLDTQRILGFNDHTHALEIMAHLEVASSETDETTGLVRLFFADREHMHAALEWIKSKLKTLAVRISRETQEILGFNDHKHALEIMDHLEVASSETEEEEGLIRLFFADEEHRTAALEWMKTTKEATQNELRETKGETKAETKSETEVNTEVDTEVDTEAAETDARRLVKLYSKQQRTPVIQAIGKDAWLALSWVARYNHLDQNHGPPVDGAEKVVAEEEPTVCADEDARMVVVQVTQGKGLDDASDVYAKVLLNDEEIGRTDIVEESANPVWGKSKGGVAEFAMSLPMDDNALLGATMRVEVHGDGGMMAEDQWLGHASLSGRQLTESRDAAFYPLLTMEGHEEAHVRGEVQIALTYRPSGNFEAEAALENKIAAAEVNEAERKAKADADAAAVLTAEEDAAAKAAKAAKAATAAAAAKATESKASANQTWKMLISKKTQDILGFADHEHAVDVLNHLQVASTETDQETGLVRLFFADKEHRVDAMAWIKTALEDKSGALEDLKATEVAAATPAAAAVPVTVETTAGAEDEWQCEFCDVTYATEHECATHETECAAHLKALAAAEEAARDNDSSEVDEHGSSVVDNEALGEDVSFVVDEESFVGNEELSPTDDEELSPTDGEESDPARGDHEWQCEFCEEAYDTEQDCANHESSCSAKPVGAPTQGKKEDSEESEEGFFTSMGVQAGGEAGGAQEASVAEESGTGGSNVISGETKEERVVKDDMPPTDGDARCTVIFNTDMQHIMGIGSDEEARTLMADLNVASMDAQAETGLTVHFDAAEHAKAAESWAKTRQLQELQNHVESDCSFPFCAQTRRNAEEATRLDFEVQLEEADQKTGKAKKNLKKKIRKKMKDVRVSASAVVSEALKAVEQGIVVESVMVGKEKSVADPVASPSKARRRMSKLDRFKATNPAYTSPAASSSPSSAEQVSGGAHGGAASADASPPRARRTSKLDRFKAKNPACSSPAASSSPSPSDVAADKQTSGQMSKLQTFTGDAPPEYGSVRDNINVFTGGDSVVDGGGDSKSNDVDDMTGDSPRTQEMLAMGDGEEHHDAIKDTLREGKTIAAGAGSELERSLNRRRVMSVTGKGRVI